MNAKRPKNALPSARRDKKLRQLDEMDISDIAESAQIELSANQKEVLRTELNRSIAIRNQMRRSLQALAPSRNLDRSEKLQKGIKLIRSQILEIWSLSGGYNVFSELPSRYRASAEVLLAERVKEEFGELLTLFHQAWSSLSGMLEVAEMHEKQQRTRLNGKHHAKSVDWVRYIFIEEVADIYGRTFERRASMTEGGPWCHFLAEVLGRCERRAMTNAGAFALWRKVRSEGDRKMFLAWAEPRV